jgi:hypothetical protein
LSARETVANITQQTTIPEGTHHKISTAGIAIIQSATKTAVGNIAEGITEIAVGIEHISILTFEAVSIFAVDAVVYSAVEEAGVVGHGLFESALADVVDDEERELAGASGGV